MKELILQSYVDWLRKNENAENTIKRYIRSIKNFISFYEETKGEAFSPDSILPGDLQEWKKYMMNERRYSDSTINNYIDCLRPFFQYLIEHNYIYVSPASRLKNIKIQNSETIKWLTDAEEANLCFIVDNSRDLWNNEWLFKRNLTAFYFMLYGGLRISEVCALNIEDIQNGFIKIRHSKGNKSRQVYMSKKLAQIFIEYLPYRQQRVAAGKIKESAQNAVFLGERGNRFTVNGLSKVMAELSQFSRITLTAHTLRHTFAHNLIKSGATLTEVADILGHDSIQTTKAYTSSSKEEQANAIERATNK